jgi:organic radical activating enzyme
MKEKANINEIFVSVQGEGVLVGAVFVFVRFSSCNLSCDYCDTRYALEKSEFANIILDNKTLKLKNPLDIADFSKLIPKYPYRNWTFTGGEPMLHARFIEEALPILDGKYIMMETNATLHKDISAGLTERVDCWSCDLKLPSVSGGDTFKSHLEFLEKLYMSKFVVLKAVFSDKTSLSELRRAFDIARDFNLKNPRSALVFQPVTKNGKISVAQNLETVISLMKKADFETRLIPQVHKLAGFR